MIQVDPPWHAGRGAPPPPSGSCWTTYESPLGPLTVLADVNGVRHLHFDGGAPPLMPDRRRGLAAVEEQLAAYFAGQLRTFDLPLALRGNRFERAVWTRLQQLPYGTTSTYGRLARDVDPALFAPGVLPGRRTQLIAYAVARNPAPIFVPSHRAVSAGGHASGRDSVARRRQLALLELERLGLAGTPPEPDPLRPQLALL
jgi:methylated-DNA-[protein]-cysteine S-methyltransferase